MVIHTRRPRDWPSERSERVPAGGDYTTAHPFRITLTTESRGFPCAKEAGSPAPSARGIARTSRGHRAEWRKGGSRGGSGTRPPSDATTARITQASGASARARERSERASECARVPRAYVRGISLCLSWFQVCYICVFACNRVTHLLMRNLALEDISICAIYIQRFLVDFMA